ncbi:acetolactate synthase 3 catalytic subunit [Salmonella enterica subsp. arizonae]|uniref:Acetolactate synthase 3 catalytic subunit n=1 Tax=Salmonella enterica subsp. arizonae TaxID=59203 RepID=A0A379T194_SALER|nr:acetolactate synthase 3 catalytic subunit [Salmonella enterica subsp. arizonae]
MRLPGIATAYMDSIPLVILSGQVATSLIGYDAFQECDMVGISRPVVKHSFLVKHTEDIPQVLKKAFWLAARRASRTCGRGFAERYSESGEKNAVCLAGKRSVCALTIPQRQDIKGKLNVRCKRWRRRNNRWFMWGGGAISAACLRAAAPNNRNLQLASRLFVNGDWRVSCDSSPVVRDAGNAWHL